VRFRFEYLVHQAEDDGDPLTKSLGYLVHLGVVPVRRFELLGRYELLEPDTGAADNELIWITAGVNLDLSDHARVSANYIFKDETGDEVKDGGNRVRNDEFLAGVTVWW